MFRRSMLLIMFLLITACTLTRVPETAEPSVKADDTILQVSTETPTATPTVTETPTPTPTATSTPRTAILPLPNCTIRTSWPVYVVAGGDTLASIARRINSTISELTTANCLAAPNIITPGQQLRVPRLPVGLPNPDTSLGNIQVSPFVYAEGGSYTVQANTTISVMWPEARRDAIRVEFRGTPVGGGSSTLLGIDTFPADGAAILTSFAVNFGQAISAIAYLPNGSRQLTANSIPVFSIQNNPPDPRVQGEVIISPYLRIENGVRIVEAGQTVTLRWQGAPVNEGTQFVFAYHQDGIGLSDIGIDNNGADGVAVPWTVPHNLTNAQINASIRLPGQTHEGVTSHLLTVTSEEVIPGTVGQLTISPILREDSGWIVLSAGEIVTITWQSPPTGDVERVEFYLAPTGTGSTAQLIGTDDNPADGVSLNWEAPQPFSAHLSAKAFVADGRTIEPDNLLQLTSE